MLKRVLKQLSTRVHLDSKTRTDNNICEEDSRIKGGGERQASKELKGISLDHKKRYELATKYMLSGTRLLDIACGVGYGSYILAQESKCQNITAIDISDDAIAYANKYYYSPKITYKQGDCVSYPLEQETYDMVVSFETIEHIENDRLFLDRVFMALKPGGTLALSTPNEAVVPYEPEAFPFHVRHYTPEQLEDILTSCGFTIDEVFSQVDKRSPSPIPGWNGKYNIVICSK